MTLAERVALALYATVLRLATPVYLARLWWRGRAEPGYRQHWNERLGFGGAGNADGKDRKDRKDGGPSTGRLWLHAVSLGETRAAAPLIEALRAQRPGLRLLLTHGTATGRAAGMALLRPGDAQVWLPYDTPGAVRRFFARHRPVAGVLMETEVWPNLLHAARAAGVPTVLANARLSERSLRKGLRLAVLTRPAVAAFDAVLAQTAEDARRLRAAGARDAAVQVMGNLKFDLSPAPELLARGRAWRRALGRPVVLAAVTRGGEEAPLLAAWQRHVVPQGRTQGMTKMTTQPAPPLQPLLLLVPRHPQRFDEVAGLVAAAGLSLARRSLWAAAPADPAGPTADAMQADVWLGDSLGEMPLYYATADVALLGGSFEPLGGQNLIEAAACGCPLLMGPHTFNFAQAANDALAAGAAERVADFEAAVLRATALLADAPGRDAQARRALAFAAAHRGAAVRMARAITDVLRPGPGQ